MISVVIPTYHRNDLLARCLDQLAPGRQLLTADQYEVVVSDDGRITTAERLIREQYRWARWTKGPGRGPAANRNLGVRNARGEWIAFTDDDCVPTPQWLKAFVDARQDGIEIYEGKTTCVAGQRRFVEEAPINLNGGALFSCNFMISRNVFRAAEGFDERFDFAMEDIDLRDRLRVAGHHSKFVPLAVVDHPPRKRIHGVSAGRLWESRVYYDTKWGVRTRFRYWLPVFVAKVRIAEMFHNYPFRDFPAATASMAAEVLYVVGHVGRWERRHANVAAAAIPRAHAESEGSCSASS